MQKTEYFGNNRNKYLHKYADIFLERPYLRILMINK